jgi:neopullulanase
MTPDWVQHAVFYQIFPDRFARSGRVEAQDGLALKPWGADPAEQGFQGGDLYGVVERLDALQALGVTALYLNPIFASAANHRYHTYDYYRVDPLLGGNEALRALLDAAHDRGMRVVLDGVFNHASRGFWPFHHVLENGGTSPYVDWFDIQDWPLRPYAPDPDSPPNYAAWMDIPALPEFNTDHPEVRQYLFDVATHWIEFGIDGWRLDVPYEIDDNRFWQDFRDRVKDADPEAYIVGEAWGEAQRWLQGDQFDAVMNYPRARAVLSFFGADTLREYRKGPLAFAPLDAPAFAEEIRRLLDLYPRPVVRAQLNLLSSHDTARALWIVGDDPAALRLAVLFQMTMPGAPCLYYGDEIGLSSRGDPHCRAAFPWADEDAWNHDLRAAVADAAALRHAHAVLRTGHVEICHAEGRVLVIRRHGEEGEALLAFNAGPEAARVALPMEALAARRLAPVWPPNAEAPLEASADTGPVRLPAQSARVWVA